MSILPIRIHPDPVLRQKSKRVGKIDASIQRLIDDMFDTMRSASGVGLAAPQVGKPIRVIVIEVPGRESLALINPVMVRREGRRRVEEGCLSIPGYKAEITRSITVTVRGLDREGRPVRIKAVASAEGGRDEDPEEALLAQALEHEIDHLNGVLYIDYLESPDQLVRLEPEETASEGEPVRVSAGRSASGEGR